MPYCEKHGLDSVGKCKKCIMEKREKTMIERYGVCDMVLLFYIKATNMWH